MIRYMVTCLILLLTTSMFAQEGYPLPSNKEALLFYIQHNRGKNAYCYTLNYGENHNLDREEPIRVFRQIFDNKGEIKPLSVIQRRFAYGIQSNYLSATTYEASIVALPSQKLYLQLPKNGKPYVETTVNGVKMVLHRIFIGQKEGTYGLGTKLDYIIFYGTSKNKPTTQKITF